MNEILSQLGHLFIQTLPTVLLVFVLLVVLNPILFGPVIGVLKRREEATSGALERSRQMEAEAEKKSHEYEDRFQSARQEVYRQREADRRIALTERDERIQQARKDAESELAKATAELAGQVKTVERDLAAQTQSLAGEITERVLGEITGPDGSTGPERSAAL